MRRILAIGLPLLALAGVAGAQDSEIFVKSAMQGNIAEATNAIWDIGNHAMSDDGGIDPARMDDATWTRLEAASARLADASRALATASAIKAAPPGQEQDEQPGTYSMADVQSYIDANPAAFRELAAGLGDYADSMAEAARAKDAKTAGDLVSGLDGVCEACHAKYWYPQG